MRFLHTADWHLGRVMYGARLIEDQVHVLEQVLAIVKEGRPDVLIVSGDVYDRSVPPPEAIEVLDEFLSRAVLGLGVPVVLIAGNHDSPSRLDFASRLLSDRGLHIFGSVSRGVRPVVIGDQDGPAYVYGVPYVEPATMRNGWSGSGPLDHEAAMGMLFGPIRSGHPDGCRSVLVCHAYVAGGTSSESERPLSVGGSESVRPVCFDGFDYVALGHLHRAQDAGKSRMRYAGSLLKYSFSESGHAKTVDLVEMDANGNSRVESVPLSPRRDVRRIEGMFAELLLHPPVGESRDDYVMVTLLDEAPILDAMGRLREVYPNALHVERPALNAGRSDGSRPDHRKLNDKALFAAFFDHVTGNPLGEDLAAAYDAVAEGVRRDVRNE
jgi:DNA repair protein SbcD/Mre11